MAIFIYPANFPAGVTYANVLIEATDFTGAFVSGEIKVEGERKVAWAGSPRLFTRFSRTYRLRDGACGIPVPHTNQLGFISAPGVAVVNWGYKFSLITTRDGAAQTLAYVQVPSSVGASVNLHGLVDLGGWPNQIAATPGPPTGNVTYTADPDPGDEGLYTVTVT